MLELTLTTPTLLFSAISLLLLAYTNRFVSYASIVRALHDKHLNSNDPRDKAQIVNLRKRLHLIRWMQLLGILSFLLSAVSMFLIYISWQLPAAWVFGAALLLLIGSMLICAWEINISVHSLDILLDDIDESVL